MLSVIARDISVEFPIYEGHSRSLRHRLGLGRIARTLAGGDKRQRIGGQIDARSDGRVVIQALEGINLDFRQGDRIALMGQNGSGKTTLLRTIAGIYEPTRGSIEVAGHVTPMFSLTFGMDPDSTGMENVLVRSRMLGLSDDTIATVIQDVIEFSELGDYLDMPIRRYSAGMLARLALTVSTAVKPEILVLDEFIGAADAAFAERARERSRDLVERTGILVLASHSAETLRAWCNKGVVLARGQLVFAGPIAEAQDYYSRQVSGVANPAPAPAAAVDAAAQS